MTKTETKTTMWKKRSETNQMSLRLDASRLYQRTRKEVELHLRRDALYRRLGTDQNLRRYGASAQWPHGCLHAHFPINCGTYTSKKTNSQCR